ncbi:MAG: hypothetical protein IKN81_04910 [Oscillospiraceae bacterium]|nr:hypothetical protein [Oscillospiraceae bacterium]
MKRLSALLAILALLSLTLPAYAAAEEIVSIEEELVIEDEDVPLAALPGVSRSDVAHVMIGVGVCMIAAAGVILTVDARQERARAGITA